MSVSSVYTATKSTESYTAATVTNKSQTLGKDDFLQLMIAQMKYQDPLEPMDNKESIAQLAQFTSLEKMEKLNETLESFGTYQKSLNALNGANMIGKTINFKETQTVKSTNSETGNVEEKEEDVNVTGTVTAVTYVDGEPKFTVVDSKGAEHSTQFSSITSVKDAAANSYLTNSKLNNVIAGASMVGRTIEGTYMKKTTDNYGKVTEVETNVSGTVKSVSFSGETPTLKITGEDGEEYTIDMEDVLSVV